MAGLDGTIKTPVGTVQKKTALIVGGGVLVIAGIVWYRQRGMTDPGVVTDPDAPINPATGYPYGSAEDAAALAEQARYVSPPANDPTGGGSGSIPPSNIGYASNGQWVQGVIGYMTTNGLIEEPTQLSAALGKYITGAYADDAAVALIQQAIAVQGYPPLSGPNGYPPSLNRTPPTPTTPPVMAPAAGSGRGYGWAKAVRGDNSKIVSQRHNITEQQFLDWNQGMKNFPVGKWLKVRGGSNPTWGYTGK
jgi:hypothetical protein